MLNDNYEYLLHPHHHFYQTNDMGHDTGFFDYRTHFARQFLAQQIEEQDRQRQHQVYLQKQAYLEALERKKREKNRLEERRHRQVYLQQLEGRIRSKEEEQRRIDCLIDHLVEQQRLENLRSRTRFRIKKQRAAAIEASLQRQAEEEERRRGLEAAVQRGMIYQLVEDQDGNLCKMNNDSTPLYDDYVDDEDATHTIDGSGHYSRWNLAEQPSLCNGNCLDSDRANDVQKEQRITFKNCFNVNTNGAAAAERSSKGILQQKNRIFKKKSMESSSVLVEDASDSECEDEYHDYIRNRRPQAGEWIEPIELMK